MTRSLNAASLLEAWERGLAESASRRALLLLEAAGPEPADELARLPVGHRDARLLDLRKSAFGPRLESVVACPACGESLEFSTAVDDLRRGETDAPAELELAMDGFELRFRPPTGLDLEALPHPPTSSPQGRGGARQRLLERCLLEARRGGSPVSAEDLPANLVEAMARAMEEADPQAHLEIDFTCPDCAYPWTAPFDIASFLWTETDAWARRTLGQVHALALAYGWSEAEVLALSAGRRQLYLDLIGR